MRLVLLLVVVSFGLAGAPACARGQAAYSTSWSTQADSLPSVVPHQFGQLNSAARPFARSGVARTPSADEAAQAALNARLAPSSGMAVGAIVGAAVGAGLSTFAALSLCDAENCLTHPDTWKIVAIGVGGGAAIGLIIGRIVDIARNR